MNALRKDNQEIILHPGQTFFGGSGARIGTLLGSCIAICLWHPILKIGGMCHYVLPTSHSKNNGILNGRYGADAIKILQREARLHGTGLAEYHASIYGGGNVVAALAGSKEDTIGARNAGFAMETLIQNKVSILVVDVGETWSRRISFDTSTGLVVVKRQGNTFITL